MCAEKNVVVLYDKINSTKLELFDIYKKDVKNNIKSITKSMVDFISNEKSFFGKSLSNYFNCYIFDVADEEIEMIKNFPNGGKGFYVFFVKQQINDVDSKDFNTTVNASQMIYENDIISKNKIFYVGKADNLRDRVLNKHILSDERSNETTGNMRLSSTERKGYKKYLSVYILELKEEFTQHYQYLYDIEKVLKNNFSPVVGQ